VRPHPHPLHAPAQELVAVGLRVAEVHGCPVVQGFQLGAAQPLREAQAVVAGVGRQLRVVGGHQGYAVAARVVHAAGAQHDGVHRVHEVRPEAPEGATHAGVGRAQLLLRVGGERDPGDPVDARPGVGFRPTRRGEDENLVPHPSQLLDGVAQAGDDAVGGRQERLGEHRDAHPFYLYRSSLWPTSGAKVPARAPSAQGPNRPRGGHGEQHPDGERERDRRDLREETVQTRPRMAPRRAAAGTGRTYAVAFRRKS